MSQALGWVVRTPQFFLVSIKKIKKIKKDLKRYKKFLSLLTHVQLFYLFLCYTNIHIYTHKYTNFV